MLQCNLLIYIHRLHWLEFPLVCSNRLVRKGLIRDKRDCCIQIVMLRFYVDALALWCLAISQCCWPRSVIVLQGRRKKESCKSGRRKIIKREVMHNRPSVCVHYDAPLSFFVFVLDIFCMWLCIVFSWEHDKSGWVMHVLTYFWKIFYGLWDLWWLLGTTIKLWSVPGN